MAEQQATREAGADVTTWDHAERLFADLKGCVLTVGNFDGVHLGHRAILEQVVREATAHDAPSVALTFEPHPVRFFSPSAAPFRLTDLQHKARILRRQGIDRTVALVFDDTLSRIEPEEFVRTAILRHLEPCQVIVGYDFNYGRDRKGTPELLSGLCAEAGVPVVVQKAIDLDDATISSTRVRRAVREGDAEAARRLLGRPYAIVGPVASGAKRGRKLGFPTANLTAGPYVIPKAGVYASWFEYRNAIHHSITNVGVRPTFGGGETTIETFVLDLDDELDCYGARVAVHFTRFIRPERAFDSTEALVAQITRDIDTCRQMHRTDHRSDLGLATPV